MEKVMKLVEEMRNKLIALEKIFIDSEKKFIDSKKKLIDSEKKLIDSEKKLIDSEKKLIDSEKKLIDSEKKLDIVQGKCEEQKQHILHLTHELSDAYDEISRLKKRLKDVEKDGQIKNDSLELRENGRNPLTVFPEEVWEMIFDNLEDPKDLKNCYDANPLFQSVLQKRRKDFLITDVLRILAARGDLGNPSQATSQFLKYRLVDSSWKKSIDNLFQDEVSPPIFPTSTEYAFQHPKLIFEYRRNPWRDQRINTLSADVNPLISRFLEYHESFPYEGASQSDKKKKQRLREDFTEFLKKFGHHVWYFKVQIGEEVAEQISTAWFGFLKTWLSFLPNLKALHIDQYVFRRWDHEDSTNEELYEYTSSDSEESAESTHNESDDSESTSNKPGNRSERQRRIEIENLKQQLQSGSFPTIKSLRTLVLEDCLPSLATSVIKNNPQIERLKIKRDLFNSTVTCLNDIKLDALQEYYLDVQNVNCSEVEPINCTLRKLSVRSDFASPLTCDDLYKRCFGETVVELNLDCMGWPLELHSSVDYQFKKNMNSQFKSLKKLTITELPHKSLLGFFQSLSEGFGTIVAEIYFRIKVNYGKRLKLTEYPRLNMPSVKILNLEIPYTYPSIDCVLLLLNLEILNVIVKKAPLGQDNMEKKEDFKDLVETIKFEQFISNVRESNIWQLLPKLQQVNIRVDYLVSTSTYYEPEPDIEKSTWQYCSRNHIKGK